MTSCQALQRLFPPPPPVFSRNPPNCTPPSRPNNMASAVDYVRLASTLPPMLHRFFARFPPGSNAANIFRHTKSEVTGRWHNPKYSLRRQKELVKLSQDYGVEELLPPTVKSSVARAEKAVLGPRLRRMMTPKGKGWERSLRSKYVYSGVRWTREGTCVLMVWGGGQIGGAHEGDGGDAGSYREVAEAGTREGVEGVAEVDIRPPEGEGRWEEEMRGELIWISEWGGGRYWGVFGGGLRTPVLYRKMYCEVYVPPIPSRRSAPTAALCISVSETIRKSAISEEKAEGIAALSRVDANHCRGADNTTTIASPPSPLSSPPPPQRWTAALRAPTKLPRRLHLHRRRHPPQTPSRRRRRQLTSLHLRPRSNFRHRRHHQKSSRRPHRLEAHYQLRRS